MEMTVENDPFSVATGFCLVCHGAIPMSEVKPSVPQMCGICRPKAYHALKAYFEGKITIEGLADTGVKCIGSFLFEDRILEPAAKGMKLNPTRPGLAKWVMSHVVDGADMPFVRRFHAAILEKYNSFKVKNVGGFFHKLGEAIAGIGHVAKEVVLGNTDPAPEPTPAQIEAALPGGGAKVTKNIPESHAPQIEIAVPDDPESEKDRKRKRLNHTKAKGKKGAKPSDTPAAEQELEDSSSKEREGSTPEVKFVE